MKRTSAFYVPFAMFAVATALSILVGPVPIVSARRAAQDPTSCKTHIEIPMKPFYLPQGDAKGDETKPGNKFFANVWWTGAGGPRKLVVTIEPSQLTGQCINKGEKGLEDYTLEAGENKLWEISDSIIEYAGAQNTVAVTRHAYPPNVKVPIVITSYDWGGRVTINAQAQGCDPVKDEMPQDTDKDTLPDLWEQGQFFWDTVTQKPKAYDIGSPDSGGGGFDGAKDLDVGWRWINQQSSGESAKVHDELGDGFATFDEYRGLFIQGKHYRMDLSPNDDIGSPQTVDGPLLKQLFVYDPDRHLNNSEFARLHQINIYRIRKDEMSDAGTNAGLVNKNSTYPKQHAIWVKNESLPRGAGVVFGNAQSFTINAEPSPILLDPDNMKEDSNQYKPHSHNYEKFRDYVLAHELGHKVSLRHPSKPLVAGPDLSNAYSDANFWFDGTLKVWCVFQKMERIGAANELQFLSIFEPRSGISEPVSEAAPEIHGTAHVAHIFRIGFVGAPPVAGTLWLHKGELMDWTHEHGKLQNSQPEATLKQVALKP